MIERSNDGTGAEQVAILRLAHGPVNAMDVELCDALAAAARDLAADPAQAVVITGAGRSFSAGADLKRLLDEGEPYARRFFTALDELFRAVFAIGKPVVAAVNGHAIAGGCILAACADITLMADGKGRIGLPELKVGVPFPRSASEVVRYAVGDVAARRLVIGAETYGPPQAFEMGLIDGIIPAEDLLPAAVTRARELALEIPADAFAHAKTQLRSDAVARIAAAAGEDAAAADLWVRRTQDGWTAKYLAAVTGK